MAELVIKIPEKEFGIELDDKFQDFFSRLKAEIKAYCVSNENLVCGAYELETIDMFLEAFTNSISLPKEHGKLIDADKEIQNFCNKVCGCTIEECEYGFYCPLVQRMISAPAIIEAEKKDKIDSKNLCDSCVNNSCIFQSGIIRKHCDFYKKPTNLFQDNQDWLLPALKRIGGNDLLPSCEQEKEGYWIEVDTNEYTCSECNHCFSIVPEDNSIEEYKFCPHCKTKMIADQIVNLGFLNKNDKSEENK